MLRALKTAALGMTAQQLNVDVIANNLANVNTTGFKKSQVEFQDLLYETLQPETATDERGMKNPISCKSAPVTVLFPHTVLFPKAILPKPVIHWIWRLTVKGFCKLSFRTVVICTRATAL